MKQKSTDIIYELEHTSLVLTHHIPEPDQPVDELRAGLCYQRTEPYISVKGDSDFPRGYKRDADLYEAIPTDGKLVIELFEGFAYAHDEHLAQSLETALDIFKLNSDQLHFASGRTDRNFKTAESAQEKIKSVKEILTNTKLAKPQT